MKLSLEQFLDRVDVELAAMLALSLPEGKRKEFWPHIRAEEKRVAGLRREFDYRFVLTTRVDVLRFSAGLCAVASFRVEGEEERKLEDRKTQRRGTKIAEAAKKTKKSFLGFKIPSWLKR